MTFIASVATYKKRAPHIRATVESICAQEGIERVLVMVGSDAVAEQARKACDGLPIEAVLVPEIGPGKKHLAATACKPDDIVVTFDDDRIYPEGMVTRLTAELAGADGPVGLLGFIAARPLHTVGEGPCDFLHGEYGWAYKASWIPTDKVIELGSRPELFANDDVYLGWLLARAGQRCHVINDWKFRGKMLVNDAARKAGALRHRVDSRQEFNGAMDATWWSDRPASVAKFVLDPSTFAR